MFARTCVDSKKEFIIRVVKIVISFVLVNASNILIFRVLGLRSAIFCKITSLFAIMALLTSSWARLYTIFVREFSPTVATGLGPSVVVWGLFLVIFISLITCIVIIMQSPDCFYRTSPRKLEIFDVVLIAFRCNYNLLFRHCSSVRSNVFP